MRDEQGDRFEQLIEELFAVEPSEFLDEAKNQKDPVVKSNQGIMGMIDDHREANEHFERGKN